MKNDGTDWDALVEKRLAEARRNRQAEVQASEPAPGPEAAAKVIDRIRAASEAEAPSLPAAPPSPAEAPRHSRGTARPPMSARERRQSERHLHSFSWHRVKRRLLLLVLLILFLGGVCLTFSPQLKHIFHFLGPDRDTAGDGLIGPPEPAGKPKEPKPAAEPPGAGPVAPQSEPPKSPPPTGDQNQPPVTKPPAVSPVPAAEKPQPESSKPEPVTKSPEKKPLVPLEPAKPVDPSVMPKPPEPPKLPAPPKGPWDTQGKEQPRPVEPRDSVG